MYLKRLDIIGFKSFANKTAIKFSKGITAVVGPNGCGKTNILDALRWVLGEQRTSLLRGNKMEEIIFNGTNDVKPLGMAEATLTLVNNRGVLPTEYNEVQITRRLFRSGESEYLLNKIPCRLKDITELFYDTGVGARSYSVIQQEMIDAVISDKAEERRFLFEEAAGITKYKQRKKAALRKLDATESDFLRLKDIYSEVQTQVRSLKRQYKKAERYQTVADEIKDWELHLSSKRINEIEKEKREIKARLESLTDQISERETTINSLSSRLETERNRQIDLEQELTKVNNQAFDFTEQAHSMENKISVLTEKRSNARTLCERNENDIKALQERANILGEQTLEAEELQKQQEADSVSLSENLNTAQASQADADKKLLEARSLKENENRLLLELEGKLSSGKTEEVNLKEQESELSDLTVKLKDEIEEKQNQFKPLKEKLDITRNQLSEFTSQKSTIQSKLEELTINLESLVERNEELGVELSNLVASREACQARKSLLEEMIVQYEGYDSGVVATMEERERWPGISGTVAEKFVPSDGMEIATEAALGELAGFIVCNDRKTAEDVITRLKAEKKGKIGILVPDSGMLNPVVKRPPLDLPEFIGWLDSYISTDENLRPLMQAVLSRTAIFKSGVDPSSILERLPYGFQAVSIDGMVYSKNIISGGSDDKFPLFRRKEKVDEQDKILNELEEQHQQAEKQRSSIIAEIAGIRAQSGTLTEENETLTEDIQKTQQELNDFEYQNKTNETEINRLENEYRNNSAKLESIRNRQYSLNLNYTELAGKKENLLFSMTEANDRLSEYEQASSTTLEQVSKLQVEVVEARSRIEQTESKLSHIRQLRDEIANTTVIKKTEISEAESEIETSTESINRQEQELKQIFENRSHITESQSRLQGVRSEIQEELNSKETELKKIRVEKETSSDERHQLEMRQATFESEIKAISDRIREEYEADIYTLTDIHCPDESLDYSNAQNHLREIKERLKNYGVVNLLALDEYKTANEREAFLCEQIGDLESARDDLKKTISKINKTARQLFNETFEKVQQNFKKLFVELFTGGEATINLINPDDPLESDIDIVARPRGKKLLSITMMSGGERALTAISLLFSLYLVKPSPFCILDEIDAPLDDANCRRFLKIIDKFSNQTQFVTITHNKITMEVASNLYGVTMEQPGISQIVAVRFNEDKENEEIVTVVKDFDAEDEPVNINDEIPNAIRERIEMPLPSTSESDENQ